MKTIIAQTAISFAVIVILMVGCLPKPDCTCPEAPGHTWQGDMTFHQMPEPYKTNVDTLAYGKVDSTWFFQVCGLAVDSSCILQTWMKPAPQYIDQMIQPTGVSSSGCLYWRMKFDITNWYVTIVRECYGTADTVEAQ